jgi:hypothetical protein
MPLTRSLRRSGLAFFLIVFFLRLGNTFTAIYARPSLVFLTVLYVPSHPSIIPGPFSPTPPSASFSFTWSSVTIILNHSLFRLRKADVRHYLLSRNSSMDRMASPFEFYRTTTGPDFDKDVLDEFEDIKVEVADELKLQSFEILSRRPREITLHSGNAGISPRDCLKFTGTNR